MSYHFEYNSFSKTTRKIFVGLILILAAAAVIASALGVWPEVGVWPAIWSVLLLLVFAHGIHARSFFMIIMPLAVIAVIYRVPLHIEKITPGPLLIASALVALALTIVFPRFKKSRRISDNVKCTDSNGNSYTIDSDGTVNMDGASNTEVNFGSQSKYFKDEDFKCANLEVNFGEIKAYFVDAKLHENHGVVNCECNFGSMELYVPNTWNVVINDSGAFSGCVQKGDKHPDGINTLIVNSSTNFGGLTIFYV